MDILGFFILILILIGIVRWWVWRDRIKRVNARLAEFSTRLATIEQELGRLRSAQREARRETTPSPAPAPVTGHEIPAQRPSPPDAPVGDAQRGAPAPAR